MALLRSNSCMRNLKHLKSFMCVSPSIAHRCNVPAVTFRNIRPLRSTTFSTAAPKSYFNENTEETTLTSDDALQNIDKALTDMSYHVQRTGRTLKSTLEKIISDVQVAGCTSTHGLYLIRAAGLLKAEMPSVRVELADKIFQMLLSKPDFKLDISHCNALLKVYVECNHSFSPSDYLKMIDSHGLVLDKKSYVYLMEKYCNEGNLDGASEILQVMKENGLPINQAIFHLLIKGNMRNNDIPGAEGIIDAMKASNLAPSAETYTVLAAGFVEQGDIESAKSVLQKAMSENLEFDNSNYLSLISSLSSEADSLFADKLILQLVDADMWRQDILNTALELIHKNLEDIAFKLILTLKNTDGFLNATNIFVKEIIKAEKPFEKLESYCEAFESENGFIQFNSAKAAVMYKKFDIAEKMFKVMLRKGIAVRLHHFNGMFLHFAEENSESGIYSTLKMMSDLGVIAEFTTFLRYVYPIVSTENPKHVLSELAKIGHCNTSAIDALFEFYCVNADFENAKYLTDNYEVEISSTFDFTKFFNLYPTVHENSNSYMKIFNYILKKYGNQDTRGNGLKGVMLAKLLQGDLFIVDNVFKKANFKNHDISNIALDTCYNILERETPNRLGSFKRLASILTKAASVPQKTMTVEEEDKELNLIQEKGLSPVSFLKQRLVAHLQEQNVDQVVKYFDQLKNVGAWCSPLNHIDAFCLFYRNGEHLDRAEKVLNSLKDRYPDFKVDTSKILEFCVNLIKTGRTEDALRHIENECKEVKINGKVDSFVRSLRRLLNTALQTGNEDLLRTLCERFIPICKLQNCVSFCLDPMIHLYAHRNDLNSAVAEFRKCAAEHQVSPSLHFLLRQCLAADDFVLVESVVNSAAEGRAAAMCELLAVCLETKRHKDAEDILQNLGYKATTFRLEKVCSYFLEQKKDLELEELMFLIKDLEHVNKDKLFQYLFKLYDVKNDFQKTSKLCNQILDSNLYILSNATKDIISKTLRRNNVPVTFSMPSSQESASEKSFESSIVSTAASATTEKDVSDLLDCINRHDAMEALDKLRTMKKGLIRKLSLHDMTLLIDILVEKGFVSELALNVQVMSYLIENSNDILKPLMEKYTDSGNVNALLALASFLPDFTLRKAFFNSYYAKAHIKSGQHEALLCELENRFDKKNKLFSMIAMEELLKVPELEEQVIALAKKYFEINFDLPMVVVWGHYMIKSNLSAADELLKTHPVAVEKVDLMIMKAVRENQDVALGKKYIECLNQFSTSQRCRERAYATLLDVLVQKNMYDDATSLVEEAKQKDMDLEKHANSSLVALSNAMAGRKS